MKDPDFLATLYDAHADALYAYLLQLTRSEADTYDLIQELFIKIARKPEQVRRAANPRSYLLRSAHHLFVDLLRKKGVQVRAVELFMESEAVQDGMTMWGDTFLEELSQAPGLLPLEQRSVLHLKIWEKKTFAEIAGILDVSPNTVASRYRYAIDKLEQSLRLKGKSHE